MEKMGVFQGSVVLIQRHDPNRWTPAPTLVLPEDGEDDSHYPSDDGDDSVEQTTVGVAWPMDRIEQSGNSYLIEKKANDKWFAWRRHCDSLRDFNLATMSSYHHIVPSSRKLKKSHYNKKKQQRRQPKEKHSDSTFVMNYVALFS